MRARFLALSLLLSLAGGPGRAAPALDARSEAPTAAAIPPGRDAALRRLLDDVGFDRPLDGGYRFRRLAVDRDRLRIGLHRTGGDGDGDEVGLVLALPRAEAAPGEPTSASFALRAEARDPDPRVAGHLAAAIASIQRHDAGDLYRGTARMPRRVGAYAPADGGRAALASLLAALALLALPWALPRRRRPLPAGTDPPRFKPTHLLPVAIQGALITYWCLYWPAMVPYLPFIALQVAFAYAVDASVGLARRGRWRFTVAPVPIVLSANLFVQFPYDELYLQLAVVAVALLGKEYARWPDGRHVFNPSALGIAAVGVLETALRPVSTGDISLQLQLAPNMTEVMLLLGLIVLFRVPVVLVSVGAVGTLLALGGGAGLDTWSPVWAPVFLVILLLATDPATSPRTGLGRLLFGALVGVGLTAARIGLDHAGVTDFYGKVWPVVLANLCVPWLDALGERVPARLREALSPTWNAAHVGAWVVVVVLALSADAKRGTFEPELHRANGTPLLAVAPDGRVTCEANPVFCQPFSFAREVAGWRARP